jgi:hypothetical protein
VTGEAATSPSIQPASAPRPRLASQASFASQASQADVAEAVRRSGFWEWIKAAF